ncbi:hypothetical protein ACFVT5_37770 [Streptomyces sp. NPDC058001]|uniref:hypothetical protein n=1 Tax=Streptomyces sp. NPDC058001 TaxID=3346300 RepID=UPI0036E319E7
MSQKIARRVSLAVTTAAIAAAGLFAAGGFASAATVEHSTASAPVSRSVQSADRHHQDRTFQNVNWDSCNTDRGPWARDLHEHRTWTREHNHLNHQAREDDARNRWVQDQISWMSGGC